VKWGKRLMEPGSVMRSTQFVWIHIYKQIWNAILILYPKILLSCRDMSKTKIQNSEVFGRAVTLLAPLFPG
jgi:hypothetical protein